MPKLVINSWAWWRAYLSAQGPYREMRLTLDGHMRCMHANGRGCWAGARVIGLHSGQNKDTVLEYRERAFLEGWLMPAPPDEAEHPGEVWACVPDHVAINPKYLLDPTVRPHRTARPTPSDLPPDISLLTPEEISDHRSEPESDRERKEQLARTRRVQLRAWLATSATVKNYLHDIDAVATLTPVTLRFDGFREVIQEAIESSSRNSRRVDD